MNDLVRILDREGIPPLRIGGPAMRLFRMPRFSRDRCLFLSPRDGASFVHSNRFLGAELWEDILALGTMGKNFVWTIRTRRGNVQFHHQVRRAGRSLRS